MGGELVNERTSNSTRRSEDPIELAGVDAELRTRVVDAHVVHPGQVAQRADRLGGLDDDGRAGQVAQLVERSRLGGSPARMIVTRSHSASTSARMWLDSSTVRPAVAQLADDVLEDDLHQRVETGGRLVQEVELDVGGERRDERHLLPVALRVGADLLGRVELEPLQQRAAPCPVETAAQGAQQVDHLTAGEVGPQVHLTGHVGQAPVQRDRVAPRVTAEHGRFAAVPAQQPQQDADGGRLAGAVRPQEAVHLPAPDRQVEVVERASLRSS